MATFPVKRSPAGSCEGVHSLEGYDRYPRRLDRGAENGFCPESKRWQPESLSGGLAFCEARVAGIWRDLSCRAAADPFGQAGFILLRGRENGRGGRRSKRYRATAGWQNG